MFTQFIIHADVINENRSTLSNIDCDESTLTLTFTMTYTQIIEICPK